MKIGWITGSHGRLIHFLYDIEHLFIDAPEGRSIEARLKRARMHVKNTIWYFPQKQRYPEISKLLERHILISDNRIFGFIYNFFARFSLSFVASTDDLLSFDDFFYSRNPRLLENLRAEIASCVEDTFGIGVESEYLDLKACRDLALFCVRDGEFSTLHNDLNQSTDYLESLTNRNSNFDNFIPAIYELTKNRIPVIRMGRHFVPRLIEGIQFYDYASSPNVSDRLDLSIWMEASFAVSTGFGADEYSILFDTPVLYVNFGEAVNREIRGVLDVKRAYLPKTVVWSQSGKTLSIEELEKLGYFKAGTHTNNETLAELGITLIENSSDDIKAAITDFRKLLEYGTDRFFVYLHGRRISRQWNNLF